MTFCHKDDWNQQSSFTIEEGENGNWERQDTMCPTNTYMYMGNAIFEKREGIIAFKFKCVDLQT